MYSLFLSFFFVLKDIINEKLNENKIKYFQELNNLGDAKGPSDYS